MNRTRLGLLGLCAALFAIMAFGASGAQAAKWLIQLKGTSTFDDAGVLKASVTAKIENEKATLLTVILGSLVHISCTAGTLINVFLEGEGKVSEGGKVQFTGCTVAINGEPATNCEVHSALKPVGTVETLEGKGQAVLHGTKVVTRLEPKSGTTFVTLQMGEECPIGESVPVTGKLWVEDCEDETVGKITHLIEEGPLEELKALGSAATIDGSAEVKLGGLHTDLEFKADH